ncbi:hypothetical protein DEO72_LG1g2414 [Vigna unguiculata]|uniref:Uncharacterized protein n=1 Tax=Vigna unguiculata TaxID=3917 RepID=A0A4D6KMD3_VIGUN|nr:hypothetical protein DEO72_LG1g2414 [Vigna unguiculata]
MVHDCCSFCKVVDGIQCGAFSLLRQTTMTQFQTCFVYADVDLHLIGPKWLLVQDNGDEFTFHEVIVMVTAIEVACVLLYHMNMVVRIGAAMTALRWCRRSTGVMVDTSLVHASFGAFNGGGKVERCREDGRLAARWWHSEPRFSCCVEKRRR